MTEKRGKWITVRPNDERVKRGCSVRLGSTEGVVRTKSHFNGSCSIEDAHTRDLLFVAYRNGPDIELWVEEEVLPLPEPGIPFWGEVEGETVWLIESDYGGDTAYTVWSAKLQDVFSRDQVTRLPIPPEELEKLK